LLRSYPEDDAVSPVIGIVLNVAIVMILAMLVLLMFHLPSLYGDNGGIPVIFTITSVDSIDEITHTMNFDSRIVILHKGMSNYPNRDLSAKFFKNGVQVNSRILTMNGHDFIETTHTGVQWMGGSGCSNDFWRPEERICIDFTDGTFRPGDSIQMDIIDKNTNSVISRHTYAYK